MNVLALFALITLSVVVAENATMTKVNVTVYYEARCGDSKAFITQGLYPVYNKTNFREHMNLVLVPYGKATKNESGGFSCHHGPEECTGNAYEGCALTSHDITLDDAVSYINCLSLDTSGSKNYSTLTDNCTSAANAAIIKACAVNETEILDMMKAKTEEFTKGKQISSVPTVVINGEPQTGNIKLLDTMCKILSNDKLTDCPSPSTAAHHCLSFGAIIGALLLARW